MSSVSRGLELAAKLLDRERSGQGGSVGDFENPERNEDQLESQTEVGSKGPMELEND